MNILILFSLLVSTSVFAEADPFAKIFSPTDTFVSEEESFDEILDHAEGVATPGGRAVLEKGRSMIVKGEVVKGSCWDFINAVFDRSGFPQKLRQTIFKSKLQGPYVDEALIEPGDWLYFMNHSYNNIEHSGVFVEWTDFAKKEALVMSYAGGNQAKPGRYRKYDLSSVYNIIRGKL
jgi:hypothetical protein